MTKQQENTVLKALRNAEFFRGLSDDASAELASLCKYKDLKKKDILFSENTKGSEIYLLAEGSVQLSKISFDGNEIVIRTIRPGEVFAEVILFEKDRYPVTAIATGHSKVLAFSRNDILDLLGHPGFRDEFIAFLMRKQRYLAERVRYLTSYDVEQRFFMFLKEHYGDKDEFVIDLSKKDLAGAIGATPETLSRLITRLQSENKIDWNSDRIRIQK